MVGFPPKSSISIAHIGIFSQEIYKDSYEPTRIQMVHVTFLRVKSLTAQVVKQGKLRLSEPFAKLVQLFQWLKVYPL